MAPRRARPGAEMVSTTPLMRPLRYIEDYTIGATDGDVGSIDDVYFDDHSWTVRYFVVNTGDWLPGRKVLISPAAITSIDATGHRLVSDLSRQRVKDSPPVDTSRPVSRQYEIAAASYYGHPYY
jgi:hypothetical protein